MGCGYRPELACSAGQEVSVSSVPVSPAHAVVLAVVEPAEKKRPGEPCSTWEAVRDNPPGGGEEGCKERKAVKGAHGGGGRLKGDRRQYVLGTTESVTVKQWRIERRFFVRRHRGEHHHRAKKHQEGLAAAEARARFVLPREPERVRLASVGLLGWGSSRHSAHGELAHNKAEQKVQGLADRNNWIESNVGYGLRSQDLSPVAQGSSPTERVTHRES